METPQVCQTSHEEIQVVSKFLLEGICELGSAGVSDPVSMVEENSSRMRTSTRMATRNGGLKHANGVIP